MTNLGTHMYDWVFNYNPFTSKWQACKRDDLDSLYSDQSKLIISSSIDTLIQIINKTDGKQAALKKLVK